MAAVVGPTVLVLMPDGGPPLHLRDHQGNIFALAFSPDGTRLVSASDDKTIVSELPSGQTLHVFEGAGQGWAVAYSPDGGTIVTGDSRGVVKLWDAGFRERQLPAAINHRQGIISLAFSQDGRQLVSASRDKMVGVWDVASGQLIGTLSGNQDVVIGVAIGANQQLATASADGIRLWNLKSLMPITSFPMHTQGAQSLAFSRDGRYLAAGSRDGVVRVYAMRGPDLVALA